MSGRSDKLSHDDRGHDDKISHDNSDRETNGKLRNSETMSTMSTMCDAIC